MRQVARLALAGALCAGLWGAAGCSTSRTVTQNGEQLSINETAYLNAVELQHQEQYFRAIQAWREVIDDEPRWALAHLNLAIIYDRLSMVPEAIASYENAVRYDDKNSIALLGLGSAYARAGKTNAALDALTRGLAQDPYRAAIHYTLSGVYLEAKQYDKALLHADTAVDLTTKPAPTEPQGLAHEVDRAVLGTYLLRQAECHIVRKEFDKAKVALDRVELQCNMVIPAELQAQMNSGAASTAEETDR